jgi:hypothetical protein
MLDRSDPNWKEHLVAWLRRTAEDRERFGHLGDAELLAAAADEIERLRELSASGPKEETTSG